MPVHAGIPLGFVQSLVQRILRKMALRYLYGAPQRHAQAEDALALSRVHGHARILSSAFINKECLQMPNITYIYIYYKRHAHIYIYMCVYDHTFYLSIHPSIYQSIIYLYIYILIHLYFNIYLHVYIKMNISLYIFTYIYIYMYIYMCTHL